ncbi:hypothetical protein ACN20G_24845 [Streptomyces sp. BI20]|uniref:hypothetical protein n=1 Tax=Streptomyces sp. BI20 TaxID=3403460 RepID=UPI003C75AD01
MGNAEPEAVGAGAEVRAEGVDPGDEGDTAGELFVLTAALLTPARFPAVLGDDFPAACAVLGVPATTHGYGLVLGQDERGARWTVVVDDVSLVASAIAAWDCGMAYDLSPDEDTVVVSLAGWPMRLAVSVPGVPEPHDPAQGEDGTGRVPLAPPADEGWGPAHRRLGADLIARDWEEWRARAAEEPDPAASGPEPDAGTAHPGLARVRAEAAGYLERHPPAGRIRSEFAGGEARLLRVDGPGWSLTARTDDMAFVLLDAEPHGVVPWPGDPRARELFAALDALARHIP